MQRREFLHLAGLLGLSSLTGCSWFGDEEIPSGDGYDGSVIVVGAGAAGMSAAHLLAQRGIEVRVLEAAATHGGRIKTDTTFVDFPIPLGGEWLHVTPTTLPRIVNDDTVEITTELAEYREDDLAGWFEDGELTMIANDLTEDRKFVGETWLTFYEHYVLPGIVDRIEFGVQILDVDASGSNGVVLTDATGRQHSADAAIVTFPPQIVQDGDITFHPPMAADQQAAFDEADIWGGMKVFIEFSERFYPSSTTVAGTNNDDGEKLWYDAAHGQRTDHHVLGLFTVGDQSLPYQAREGDDLRDYMLAELDEIFDGAASRSYLRHIAQNWSAEPFIRQAYFASSGNWRLPARMGKTIADRVFFAGASYTSGNDWGSVHTAAESARDAVARLLR